MNKRKKKKFFKIFLLVVFLGGFGSIFVRGYVYHHSATNKTLQNNSSKEIVKQDLIDEDIISSILDEDQDKTLNDNQENLIIKDKTSKDSQNVSMDQNIKSENITKETNNKNVVNTSNNDNSYNNTNENSNTNNLSEDNLKNNEEKSNNIQENNKIEEKQVPPIDEEYLAILNQVDYKADEYSKCSSDSIEVALTDVENIRNTACKQFAYNGSIVGYKIQIFYRDGTWKYYQK